MVSKLYSLAAAFSLSTVLALVGFAGYLKMTGHLSSVRLERMAAALRGELDALPATPSSHQETDGHGAYGEPATMPSGGHEPSPGSAAHSADHAADAPPEHSPPPPHATSDEDDEFAEKLGSDWAAHDIDARQRLLERALQLMTEEREKLAAQREAAEADAARKRAEEEREAQFQKELRAARSLSPAQAKARVLKVWKKRPEDAVRLLRNLDGERVDTILQQFSSSEELEILALLQERLAEPTENETTGRSGTTAGATAP